MNKSSDVVFWSTRILVMLAVIGVAVLLLNYMPQNNKSQQSTPNRTASQRMQDNVSQFYASFRASSKTKIEEQYGDFVIPLGKSDQNIKQQLSEVKASGWQRSGSWEGDVKHRAFSKGSTILTDAEAHVMESGVNLVWALDQDFVVRHRFVSQNTLAGMLNEIAGAIDANFINTVEVYYCKNEHAMVITDKDDKYLTHYCTLVDNK